MTETRRESPVGGLGVSTAIVHDWFQGYHGAERTVDAMRQLFAPGHAPDIYTFSAAPDLLPPELAGAIVRQSRLARLPGIRQRGHDFGRWRYLLPYMPHYFARLDLDRYDLVISSSHACANNARPRPGATHVCYCYTPMRYAWMPETDGRGADGLRGVALRTVSARLKRIDYTAARRVHAHAAISTAVCDRVRAFYGVESRVIHPPVDVLEFDPTREKEPDSFLWVHRLVPYKHPHVVAEAFRRLPYRLTMVGVGPLEAELRAALPPNVRLLGWTSRTELARLYAEASGFIHVGEEDFGITMVEALASGTPVIALNRGGARDIVRHGIDGLLIAEATAPAVRAAVEQLARETWEPLDLARHAASFGRQRFLREMVDFVENARTSMRAN
jgi:glycosyltransferase involved in cell wall biosynthesis